MSNITNFNLNESKCTGCGLCKRACPAMLLSINADKKAQIKEVERLDWYGCWSCQHCLAVCPTGAISIHNRRPEDSLPMPDSEAGEQIERLITGRRSCRHYRDENVDPEMLSDMFKVLENAPSGGNKQLVEYTIVDDKEQMKKLRSLMWEGYEKLKKEKKYPFSWDEESLGIMEARGEQAMNGDMFFCSAPHLFIPHMPAKFHSAPVDTTITMTYFELMCNAKGLGTVYLGFPMNIIRMLPEVRALLRIPEDHYFGEALGFGYPEFTYARGVQKQGKTKIHRLKF